MYIKEINEKEKFYGQKLKNTAKSNTNNKTRLLPNASNAKSNPKFSGKTLGEEIFESSSDLKNTFNKSWLYDGDTFEITTLNFYKTDMNQMINELVQYKNQFIGSIQQYQKETNLFSDFGKIKIMEKKIFLNFLIIFL